MLWTTSPNTTSTSPENLRNGTLSNLQHCDGEKETEVEFCAVKQNTVEEFEFDCSRCGKKVNLMSSIPAVKTTTRPTFAGRNFVALSFLVNGQYFKDYIAYFTYGCTLEPWLTMLRHQAAENSVTGAAKKVLFSSRDNCNCLILKQFERTSYFHGIQAWVLRQNGKQKNMRKRVVKEAHFPFSFLYFSS